MSQQDNHFALDPEMTDDDWDAFRELARQQQVEFQLEADIEASQ